MRSLCAYAQPPYLAAILAFQNRFPLRHLLFPLLIHHVFPLHTAIFLNAARLALNCHLFRTSNNEPTNVMALAIQKLMLLRAAMLALAATVRVDSLVTR